ncbi:hypothetical protein DL769_004356 [Monosporascus sp. CRB-8-3]|nr:hypothetical protein DL769_004356 [Monosporascus sp. CRB-8-3]
MESSQGNQGGFHDDAELCQYILGGIATTHSLEIRESEISQAGSGLFAMNNIPEGQEIFRSSPLVECVADTVADSVCDWCYRNTLSRVHPSGRFRTKEDAAPDIESCQDQAWEAYHKHECELLSRFSEPPSKTRALHRILVKEKNGHLSPEDKRALNRLESHYEGRLSSGDGASIEEIAKAAKERTGTDHSITDISRLYCSVLTNNINIHEPGQSQVLGTALDVPMALMNHSCEPNVLTVFQGSELRVRSLRPIKAGEELLQCYTDVTCDVLMRRKRLKDQFFFDCTCSRCEREFESHKRRTFNDMSEVEVVRESQEELTDLINSAIIKMKTSPDGLPLVELEARARSLVNDAFPDSRWPDTLDPVPLLYKRLGNMHALRGNGVAAFQCSIKGCAYTDWKLGPEWVNDLHDLIRIMTAIVVQPSAREVFRDKYFLSSREFWDAYHGLLHMLLLTAQKTFGSDASYTRAIKRWYDDTLEGAEEPLPGTPDFEDRFKAVHRKLLSWAGVNEKYWRVDTV